MSSDGTTWQFRRTMSRRTRLAAARALDKRSLISAQQAMAMTEVAVALRGTTLHEAHLAMARALALNEVADPIDNRIAKLMFQEGVGPHQKGEHHDRRSRHSF